MKKPIVALASFCGLGSIVLAAAASSQGQQQVERPAVVAKSPVMQGGLIAVVDKDGNLAEVNDSQLAAFAQRSANKGLGIQAPGQARVSDANIAGLDKVLTNAPRRFSIAQIDENGNVEVYCSPLPYLDGKSEEPMH